MTLPSQQVQTDLEFNPRGESKRLVLVFADPDHAPTAKEKQRKQVKKRSGSGSGVSGAVRWLFEDKFSEAHMVLWMQQDHQGEMVKITQSRIDALGGAVTSALLVFDYEHYRLTLTREVVQLIKLLRSQNIKITANVFSHHVILADSLLRVQLSENLSPETELSFFAKSGCGYVSRGEKPNTSHVFQNVRRRLNRW